MMTALAVTANTTSNSSIRSTPSKTAKGTMRAHLGRTSVFARFAIDLASWPSTTSLLRRRRNLDIARTEVSLNANLTALQDLP